MLIKFESEVLKFLNTAVPEIKEIKYSKDESVLLQDQKNVKYPTCIYSRAEDEQTTSWSGRVFEEMIDGAVERFQIYPMKYNYTLKILCENERTAFETAKKLRFYWAKHSYVWVKYPLDEPTRVALRLLYIKLSSEDNETSKTGGKRIVEVGWMSQLCISEATRLTPVKEFRIALMADNKEQITVIQDD